MLRGLLILLFVLIVIGRNNNRMNTRGKVLRREKMMCIGYPSYTAVLRSKSR